IGTEHLLLALVSLGDGVPIRILLDCGAKPEQIREGVIRALPGASAAPQRPPADGPPASGNGFEEWIRIGPGAGLRRLLMVAGARALDDGREDIQPRDVLLALTHDEHTGPLLAELGVDDVAIARALERRRSSDGGQ
ncbi:MAG: Clp protease N-terminal domain-containing protein, partial [Solirubrobacteraceae bacterium]